MKTEASSRGNGGLTTLKKKNKITKQMDPTSVKEGKLVLRKI